MVLLLRLPLALVGVDELGVEVHLEVGVDSVGAAGLLTDAEVGADLGGLDVRGAEVGGREVGLELLQEDEHELLLVLVLELFERRFANFGEEDLKGNACGAQVSEDVVPV